MVAASKPVSQWLFGIINMWRNTIFDSTIWLFPPLTRVGLSTEIEQPPRERGNVNLGRVKDGDPNQNSNKRPFWQIFIFQCDLKEAKPQTPDPSAFRPSWTLPKAETRCGLWQSTSERVPPSPGWPVSFGESYCCFPKCGTEICWGVEWSIQQPGASMCVYTWLVWQLS